MTTTIRDNDHPEHVPHPPQVIVGIPNGYDANEETLGKGSLILEAAKDLPPPPATTVVEVRIAEPTPVDVEAVKDAVRDAFAPTEPPPASAAASKRSSK